MLKRKKKDAGLAAPYLHQAIARVAKRTGKKSESVVWS